MLKALERSHTAAIDLLGKDAPDLRNLIKIGEFAKLSGIPVSTLRYWISEGKVNPVARTQSDYVLFSPEQVAKIKELDEKRKSRVRT
ncbi:MAG: MerR family DNA-binding transcriptional regulator [Puniceicoccales bacterium]|jgi:hypothetical protein|nr:MerR family DNA-binding transcriptional regulator [Puniceicoccales bacterium]